MMQFTIISSPQELVKGFFGFFEIFFRTIIYKKKNPPKRRIFVCVVVFFIKIVFFDVLDGRTCFFALFFRPTDHMQKMTPLSNSSATAPGASSNTRSQKKDVMWFSV